MKEGTNVNKHTIIENRNIELTQQDNRKAGTFILERFNVPKNLRDLQIMIMCVPSEIRFVLVYDSELNLRAELNPLNEVNNICISIHEIHTSLRAKSGPLPPGEWMLAIEREQPSPSDDGSEPEFHQCMMMVRGIGL